METKKHCVGDVWLTKNKECPHQMVVNSTIYKYCGRPIYDICFKEHEIILQTMSDVQGQETISEIKI